MHDNHTSHPPSNHYGSLTSYVLGFAVSIIFTLTAFALVQMHVMTGHTALSHTFLMSILMILAVSQLCVQLVSFLHLGRESSPRWNLIVCAYAAVLLIALVAGSIWIMNNLNYNMGMSPSQMDAYMLDQ